MTVPAGGAATTNGILYQMLWCLLQAAKVRVEDFGKMPGTGEPDRARMILEPQGGDVHHGSRVVQLKAKSDEGTWSLAAVVAKILPDLYRAVDVDQDGRTYECITEGTVGRWGPARRFFESLKTKPLPAGNVLDSLDDDPTKTVHKKNKSKSEDPTKTFWQAESYTERTLFERIVQELRKHKPASDEPLDRVHKKLWHLLARFSFGEPRSKGSIVKEIDSILLAVAPDDGKIWEKRQAMVAGLAESATAGSAEIVVADFLKKYNLDAVPLSLSGWPMLRTRSAQLLKNRLDQKGYVSGEDVRLGFAKRVYDAWPAETPIQVITCESGQGKSWLLYATGNELLGDPALIVLVDSAREVDQVLDKARTVFVEEIWDQDDGPSLQRLGRRIREILPHLSPAPWLTLLIDGVQELRVAQGLAEIRWEDWGIRVLVACSPQAAANIRVAAGGRSAEYRVGDFTSEELKAFLEQHYGPQWVDIADGVRSTLRRPLLASIYREVAGRPDWQPTSEYALFERFWNKLRQGLQAHHPGDALTLRRLARTILDAEARYPWSLAHVRDSGVMDDGIRRLMEAGWLREAGQEEYEIIHDRLLNWAVATGIVEAAREGSITPQDLANIVRDLASINPTRAGRSLHDVPMDVVWLLTDPAVGQPDVIEAVVTALESIDWQAREALFRQILPALGERIIPLLFRKLELTLSADPVVLRNAEPIIVGINRVGGADVVAEAKRQLQLGNPMRQRAALKILATHPDSSELDRLWSIHRAIVTDASPYRSFEGEPAALAYRESFNALLACVRQNPGWLESRITAAKPSEEPVHDLAYFVANLADQELWARSRTLLMEKVDAKHERSLTANMRVYRDRESIGWLEERITRTEGLTGLMAIVALAIIEPSRAVQGLERLSRQDLYMGRTNWLPELMTIDADGVGAKVRARIVGDNDDWLVLNAFQGHEDRLTANLVDALLDDASSLLEKHLNAGVQNDFPALIIRLSMLSAVWRPDLLERFSNRRGTELEERLVTWLLRLAPLTPANGDRHGRVEALDVLRKVSADGYRRVVSNFLGSDSEHLRRDGVGLAGIIPDEETISKLCCVATSDHVTAIDGRNFPVLQALAMTELATASAWRELIAAIVRWGGFAPPEVLLSRFGDEALDDEIIRPAADALQVEGDPGVGPVLALAVAGRKDYLDEIRAIYDRIPADSQTAAGCTIALGLLQDESSHALRLLKTQLELGPFSGEAVSALFRIGSEPAHQALSGHLRDRFELRAAGFLLNKLSDPQEMAEVIAQRLMTVNRYELGELLTTLIGVVSDRRRIDQVFTNKDFRDRISELALSEEAGRVHFSGAKAGYIRALSRWDSGSAYLSARKAIRQQNAPGREVMAFLLAELDPSAACDDLFEQLLVEETTTVRRAIGRALEEVINNDQLRARLASPDATERREATFVAGHRNRSAWLTARLRELLADPDDEVIKEAIKALHKQELGFQVNAIVDSLRDERDVAKRWLLVDAMCSLGDVGVEGGKVPEWASHAEAVLSKAERRRVGQRVSQRRQKSASDDQFRDRQNRL